jgi:hypothetical protein
MSGLLHAPAALHPGKETPAKGQEGYGVHLDAVEKIAHARNRTLAIQLIARGFIE